MATPGVQDFRDLLKQADDETNRISQQITDLMNQVHSGMSDEDANEVKAGLQGLADKLKTVGKADNPPNPPQP